MTIGVAQTRPVKGDIPRNIEHHLRLVELAVVQGADVVIFPELSLTGYEPRLAGELATRADDGRFDVLQDASDTHDVTLGVGVPIRAPDGVRIGLVLFQPRQPRQVYAKEYLHPDEEPYFVPGANYVGPVGGGDKIALAICFEISVPQHAEDASRRGAQVYVASVAKSVSGIDQALERLSGIAREYSMYVCMANCVGMSEEVPSAGRSAIWNPNGNLLSQLDDAQEGVLLLDLSRHASHVAVLEAPSDFPASSFTR
ncbi:MAG TPA: carbon-nitrogen hydrolase family protein [Pirellulaceae bacterium]